MRVWPLKSLPVMSCPRITCCPYGPPQCMLDEATTYVINTTSPDLVSTLEQETQPERQGRVGNEERGGNQRRGASVGKIKLQQGGNQHGGAQSQGGGDGGVLVQGTQWNGRRAEAYPSPTAWRSSRDVRVRLHDVDKDPR